MRQALSQCWQLALSLPSRSLSSRVEAQCLRRTGSAVKSEGTSEGKSETGFQFLLSHQLTL